MGWTIKELNQSTDLDFSIRILNEKANNLTNIYSPLSKKLSKASRYLNRLELQRRNPIQIHILGGVVAQVTNFPEGFMYEVIDLDTQDIDKEIINQIPDITKKQDEDELMDHFKEYLTKYPVKNFEEFLKDLVGYLKENVESEI